MGLLGLIKSGLGIPDYWHPYLEIQSGFLSGKIRRYPISMDAKANYPGQLSVEGVPILFFNARPCPWPATVALYGLGSHDAFIATGDERYYRQMIHALHWLKNHAVPLGEGIGWSNEEDVPAFGLRAPWFSGITQGFTLSLFVRAYQLEGAVPWSGLAYQTWLGFHLLVEEGGFCRKTGEGLVYEEYPGPELDCVFNGMCHALIGLWEAWRSGLIPMAKTDFDRGLNGLRSYLPLFDHSGWSLYSLNWCLGKPLLASPYYHRANGLLAQVIGLMADEHEFRIYGERWLKTGNSIARRVRMSIRIGFERYLGAPSLLQPNSTRSR